SPNTWSHASTSSRQYGGSAKNPTTSNCSNASRTRLSTLCLSTVQSFASSESGASSIMSGHTYPSETRQAMSAVASSEREPSNPSVIFSPLAGGAHENFSPALRDCL